MLDVLLTRFRQGHRTIQFPKGVSLPERYLGAPGTGKQKCPQDCTKCIDSCPTKCIRKENDRIILDMGRCIFCGECNGKCQHGILKFTDDFRMAVRKRKDLVLDGPARKLASNLDKEMKKLFGRSLKLRQVSAGGCNACEADINVLNTLVWDLGRYGIQFVASPRHADGILVTGPVTRNMHTALLKTYEAVADPKLVIAVGACAISGGIYEGHPETLGGADSCVPVDLYIPGCPPHPATILDGLLRLLGRIKSGQNEIVHSDGSNPELENTQKKLMRNIIKS
jgi:Ni,Fe-hydrogenase III small subunit